MSVRFEIVGLVPAELEELGLGPWSVRPQAPVPFGPEQEPEIEPRWRVDFSGTLAEARAAITAGEQSVAYKASYVEALPDRFGNAIAQASSPYGAGPVRFDDSSSQVTPDDDLVDTIAMLLPPAAGRRSSHRVPTTFGSSDDESSDESPGESPDSYWSKSMAKAEEALQRIWRFVMYQAWVETSIHGVLRAHSTMGLWGNSEIIALPGLPDAIIALHTRAVALAVRSRDAWTRLLSTVLQGAAQITNAVATPVGAVAALPMAWRFVRRVLADIDKLRQAQAG